MKLAGPTDFDMTLLSSVKTGDTEECLRLLKHYPAKLVSLIEDESKLETLLHLAADGEHVETAGILIKQGADIHAKDCYGGSPLHTAAWRNNADMSKLLLKSGARINEQNACGNTPTHNASMSGSGDTLQVLLDAGADVSLVNVYGETAYDCALGTGWGLADHVLSMIKKRWEEQKAAWQIPDGGVLSHRLADSAGAISKPTMC